MEDFVYIKFTGGEMGSEEEAGLPKITGGEMGSEEEAGLP
jgi:hypothetical protein